MGLGAAAAHFGLPEHRRHHALGDALTTAQLFLATASCLSRIGTRRWLTCSTPDGCLPEPDGAAPHEVLSG